MISKSELMRWLKTLTDTPFVAIDEGGLQLHGVGQNEEPTGAYLEIGGFPDESVECTTCTARVHRDDPYFATPCGTYCSDCMRAEHAKTCDICAHEFNLRKTEACT